MKYFVKRILETESPTTEVIRFEEIEIRVKQWWVIGYIEKK